jgi:hypothetical protein
MNRNPMPDRAIRPWCAKAQFPGKEPFVGGTVILPAEARADEIEAALHAHFLTFLPGGFTIIQPICGALFFQDGTA